MHPVEVVAGGRRYVFEAGTIVVCGRSPEVQVPLTDRRVGRRHATLTFEDGAWFVRDADSRNGTWVRGHRVDAMRIDHETTVHLGNPTDGALVLITPRSAPATPLPAPAPGPGTAPIPTAPMPAPSPTPPSPTAPVPTAPSPTAPVPTAPVPTAPGMVLLPPAGGVGVGGGDVTGLVGGEQSAPVLVARLGTRTLVFPVGQPVRIGRDAHLEAVTDHPLVSRDHHGLLTSDPDGATYTDSSSRGTFHNGRRLKAPLRITEPVVLRLGDPATGEELGITPPLTADRMARQRRRRGQLRLVTGAAVVLALLAASAAVLVWTTGGPSTPPGLPAELSPETLLRAETATVRLLEGSVTDYAGSGSGTVISPDGLILTNAHVAAPSAPGMAVSIATAGSDLKKDPPFVTVEFIENDVSPAVPKYRAKVVAVDGYLDLAVVRIYADSNGKTVDPASLNLPYLDLGDVSAMRAGQAVTVLGFPGVSGSDSITVTSGIISTFVPDPLGHIDDPRFQLETTARVAHGNSGGAAILTNGQLVGVPSLAIPGTGSDLSWRLRSVAQALPLIAAAKAGTEYRSQLLVPIGGTKLTSSGIGTGNADSCPTGRSLPAGAKRAVFGFGLSGVPNGLDVAFNVQLPNGHYLESNALQGQSVPGLPQDVLTDKSRCIGLVLTAEALGVATLPNGRYKAELLAGPNLDPLGPAITLTIGS